LSDAVCRHFGFFDSRGATQVSGCAKALRELERAGHFVLPAGHDQDAARPRKRRTPRGLGLGVAVAAPLDVPEQAGEVRALQGLGSIGTNQTGASGAGLDTHSTFVVTTEGLPLGSRAASIRTPTCSKRWHEPRQKAPSQSGTPIVLQEGASA